MSPAQATTPHKGSNRLLYGMVLGVLAFWLFAQTTLNIAPIMAATLQVDTRLMKSERLVDAHCLNVTCAVRCPR
jgi:DHA2 family multidrug resistance protein-like MFS transporter